VATLVLSVVGDDRTGLVDAISGVVESHGGNWERSQMARLGGKFAGIVQVSVADQEADALRDALSALGHDGALQVSVDRTGVAPVPTGRRFVLHLVGSDRPGLLHSVSTALAAVRASIEELTSDTVTAPMSGDPLFQATITVALPGSVDIETIRTELEALADRLMVDIELED
jgi:glycine cleavage system regulatory protein